MAIVGPYPSVEDVFNAARIFLDDAMQGSTSTWGEGRVFTDAMTPMNLSVLNLALQDLKRYLENHGHTTYRVETILTPITPINSSLGLAVPNPAVQQSLSYAGFNDGLNLNTSLKLPPDLISPLKLWQRMTGTNLLFTEFYPAASGLPSLNQGQGLGWWEWRGDSIFWNGSTMTNDLRLRYEGQVQLVATNTLPANFPTTQVGVADSADCLGFKVAYIVSLGKTQPGAAEDLNNNYLKAASLIANRMTRQNQRTKYSRCSFGDEEEYPFYY